MKNTTLTLLAMLVFAWSACTTGNARPDPNPGEIRVENVDLEPMLVRADGSGDVESIDINELFERAYASFSQRDYEEAAADYELIIRHFQESRFFMPSLYNAGLSYEKLERWQDAARCYALIIERFPHKDDTTDAYYRLAQAHEHVAEWEKVVDLMTNALLRPNLSNFDRVEAHVRRSNALLQLELWQEAADGFRTAIRINEDAPAEERIAANSHFIVQSYFGIGRAYHRQVAAIRLVLPPERMGEDLRKKAELFITAQANYIRALSYHHPQWSMAAGYSIGRLYEDFHRDIFTAEIPDDLTEEHIALYFEELRKHIRPLMERAVQVYEKNLSLSRRIIHPDERNEWVQETEKHLTRLKMYLDDPATQRRAERFVVLGRDLDLLWDPYVGARDSVEQALTSAKSSARSTASPAAQ